MSWHETVCFIGGISFSAADRLTDAFRPRRLDAPLTVPAARELVVVVKVTQLVALTTVDAAHLGVLGVASLRADESAVCRQAARERYIAAGR